MMKMIRHLNFCVHKLSFIAIKPLYHIPVSMAIFVLEQQSCGIARDQMACKA